MKNKEEKRRASLHISQKSEGCNSVLLNSH